MKTSLIMRIWQAIVTVAVGGILATISLTHVNASSLSTTVLATKGQAGVGASSDIHKSQARTLSANGRESVFSSQAANLVSGPHNAMEQVYAYDRITEKVQLVSRNVATGGPGSGSSNTPTISADGRYVAYASTARDVASDRDLDDFCEGWPDPCTNIFVHDLVTKYTRTVNVDSDENRLPSFPSGVGGEAPIITRDARFVTFLSFHPFNSTNWEGLRLIVRNVEEGSSRVIQLTTAQGQTLESGLWDATINDTGRFIAFSTPVRLASNDFNGKSDIYLYDVWEGKLTFVSKGLSNFGGNGDSFEPVISTDGNSIVFESGSENLTPNDRNRKADVFLYSRAKDTTKLISNSTKGIPGTDNSFAADVSGDGQYVVYASYAPNLIKADTTDVDIFLYYTNFGVVRLMSRASHNGAAADHESLAPSISQDGKAVGFLSKAHNLSNDHLPQSSLVNNMFITFDPARQIPYYDQTDLLDLQ